MREGLLVATAALCACGEVSELPDGGGGPGVLTVVSSTPTSDAVGVALDTTISLELSTTVDADTVSTDSVRVTGAGQPVAGDVLVSGSTITFTPSARLYLFATYDVELTTAVRGTDGSTLAAAYELSFQVVDGAWSSRSDLAADVFSYPALTSNRRGDILIGYNATTNTRDVKVVLRTAGQPSFGVPENIENLATVFGDPRVALDAVGNAVVVWTVPASPVGRGWTRRTNGVWGAAAVNTGSPGPLALADDGTALMALTNGGVQITTLPSGVNTWTSPTTAFPATDSGPSGANSTSTWGVRSAGPTLQIIANDRSVDQLRARSYTSTGGLGAVQNLTPTGVDSNYVSYTFMPDDDLAFTWWQAGTELWTSRYDHATTTWSQGERVSASGSGGEVCANRAGDRIAAFASSGSLFGVYAPASQNFGTPVNLGPGTGLEVAYCELDEWGNGHLAWKGFGTTKSYYSRVKAGVPATAIEIDDGPELLDMFQDPATGEVRAVFLDGAADKLQIRTWQ